MVNRSAMVSHEALGERILSLIGWPGTFGQLRERVRHRQFSLSGVSLLALVRQCRERWEGRQPNEPDAMDEMVFLAALLQLKVWSLLPRDDGESAGVTQPAAGGRLEAGDDQFDEMGEGGSEPESGDGFDPAAWRRWVEEARVIQAAAAELAARWEAARAVACRGGVERAPERPRREFLTPVGRLNVLELAATWRRLAERLVLPKAPSFRQERSWRWWIPQLLRWLKQKRQATLDEWVRRLGRSEQVAVFLAFLELVRRGRVVGVQESPVQPIQLVWLGKEGDRHASDGKGA